MKSNGKHAPNDPIHSSTQESPAPAPAVVPFRPLALAGLTLALIGLSVWLTVPFLPAITWGVALAIMAWPLHSWVAHRIERPGLAAGISATAVTLLILVPGLFVATQVTREIAAAAGRTVELTSEGSVRDVMAETPVLSSAQAWMDHFGLDVEQEVRTVVLSFVQGAGRLVNGSLDASIQFLVTLFILFHMFRDRAELMRGLRDLLPLTRGEADQVFHGVADSVHANLYATMATSLINGVSGGLMFWLLGLPSPVMWGAVMFVLAILPVVGAGLVWVPAAIILAVQGQWVAALALTAWGILVSGVASNLVYVRLAGGRMRMHQVPAMIAFLGGLAVFGVSGMILGPAIYAVTMALIDVWRQRYSRPTEPAVVLPGAASALPPPRQGLGVVVE